MMIELHAGHPLRRVRRTVDLAGTVGVEVTAAKLLPELERAPGQPLLFRINSLGGDGTSGHAIADLIRAYPGHARAIIVRAVSAAALVALACDHRVIAENGYVMVHQISGVAAGYAVAHKATAKRLELVNAMMRRFIAQRTGLTDAQVAELDDKTLNAAACVRLGFAHEIGNAVYPEPRSMGDQTTLSALDRAISMLEYELRCDAVVPQAQERAHIADTAIRTALNTNPVPSLDGLGVTKIGALLDGAAEAQRRAMQISERELVELRIAREALKAGHVAPVRTAPYWSCGACGEANFNSHKGDSFTNPMPCVSCGVIDPSGERQ